MITQRINYHRYIKTVNQVENYLIQEIKELNEIIKKENEEKVHNHDDRYFTQREINALLSSKSDIKHNHDGSYYTKEEVIEVVNELIDQNQAEDEICVSVTKPTTNCKLWFRVLD